jgi:hypothetical protein
MYYVIFSESTWEITPPENSEDRWAYRGDYGLSVSLDSIHRSQIKGRHVELIGDYQDLYGYDDIPAGKPAHIVVVEYRTGDTFGSHGAWVIPAIKADADEAVEVRRLCEKANELEKPVYRPWDGYFENLESARVETLMVSP